jgi:hypothetical protein
MKSQFSPDCLVPQSRGGGVGQSCKSYIKHITCDTECRLVTDSLMGEMKNKCLQNFGRET